LGNKRFSKGIHQWTIKITTTRSFFMIGVAPHDIDQNEANI